VEAFAGQLCRLAEFGYLFLVVLQLHPDIGEVSGGRLATLRVKIPFTEDGPDITHTVWKILAGKLFPIISDG
jgi:hypothetical protein